MMWLQDEGSGDWIPVGARFFASVQTDPGAHPDSYTIGTVWTTVVQRPTRGVDHPPPSRTEVKERVELHLYTPSGSPWHVLGWTLPLHTMWPADTSFLEEAQSPKLCSPLPLHHTDIWEFMEVHIFLFFGTSLAVYHWNIPSTHLKWGWVPKEVFGKRRREMPLPPLDNRILFSSSTARSFVNILSYAGFTEKEKHSHCSWELFAALLIHLCSHFQKVKILWIWTIWDTHSGPDPISSLTSLWLPSSFLSCQMDENWNWIQFLFSPRKWLSQ